MENPNSSSAPLLPGTEPEEARNDGLHFDSFDEMVEWCVGGFGWRQFLQATLVSLAWFFDGQQSCISDFSDAEPSWHCTSSPCDSSSSICSLPERSWAWDGPSYRSTISEWDLECTSSFIQGLPTSAFYLGCLIGGFIFATLADSSLGRKNLLIISCLVMSLAAFATSFSTGIWMYSAFRLISGLGRASIGTCAIVLSTEMVGKDSRGSVGIMGLFIGTLGLLSLPAIAYGLRNASWRFLYLSTSIPAIFYCLVIYFFASESPKWLFMQGRGPEAMEILQKVSPMKYSQLRQYQTNFQIKQPDRREKVGGLYSSMKDLFRTPWALGRLMKVMALGFGVGMMYYGMLLGVGNLGFNLYLTVALNAIIIIPSYLASYLLINRWKRKTTLLVFSLLSGALSIVCAFMGSGISEIAVELVSFFCTCLSYNVLMICTIELFPTTVRNSATSMLRQAITLGVLLDPTLISAGRTGQYDLSYIVFGVVIICCGCVVIFLPETRGVTLSDAMVLDGQDSTTTDA